MKTKNKRHKCKDCLYFHTIYEKCVCVFFSQHVGLCDRSRTVVQKFDRCEYYNSRPQTEVTVTLELANNVIADVRELEKMFCDSDENEL